MAPATKLLLIGALKSGVSAACGLILGLPLADPEHFNVNTFGGWSHLGVAIFWVVLASEARFWKGWADAITGNGHSTPTS